MSVSPIIDGNVIYIEIVLPDIQNVIYSLPTTSVGIVSFIVMYLVCLKLNKKLISGCFFLVMKLFLKNYEEISRNMHLGLSDENLRISFLRFGYKEMHSTTIYWNSIGTVVILESNRKSDHFRKCVVILDAIF